MATIHRTLAVLALGSALIARPALAQHGSSVSLTHTVSVTVPPRVKVEVGSTTNRVSERSAGGTTGSTVGALSLSVRATQGWMLSIGSAGKSSDLQWASDHTDGFVDVGSRQTTVASGEISQIPAASTLFFRSAEARGGADGSSGEDVVMLTVVAP